MDALGSLIWSLQINNLDITQGFSLSCKDVFSLVIGGECRGAQLLSGAQLILHQLWEIFTAAVWQNWVNPAGHLLSRGWFWFVCFIFRVSICILYIVINFVLPLTCTHGGIYPNK